MHEICLKIYWIPPGSKIERPMAQIYVTEVPEDIDSWIKALGGTRYELIED
jgi:hypothetical protein